MMKFIKLSFDKYPVKFYNKTLKSSNILRLNGIGLKNKNEEEIKSILKTFDLNCVVYLVENYDMIYLEFYAKKDCLNLFHFFKNNNTSNDNNVLQMPNIFAEYVNIKYNANHGTSTQYKKDISSFLNTYKNASFSKVSISKDMSEGIIENYYDPKWLKYTQNNEINIGYYFCRTTPNKIYKSYCIKNCSSFFSDDFLNIVKEIFKEKQPNQISILNCHKCRSVEYVIECSFLFEDEIAFLVIGNELPISFFDLRSGNKSNLLLPANSLLKIRGDVRYELIFGIPKKNTITLENEVINRKNSYLIIFRFIKNNDLDIILTHKNKKCKKDKKQDSSCVPININEFDVERLERKYVLDVYNKIAQHFDYTRHRSWKNVENLINEEKEGSIIIDAGCGNGKHLSISSKYFYIGLDISPYLLKIAQKKSDTDLFLANCVHIPLRSNFADLCISIAVIHHLGTHEKRRQAISEFIRCTKVNGRVLIYVWAYEQEENVGKREFESQDIFVPWHLQQQHATDCDNQVANSNPLKKDLLKLQRYYHVFKKEEIYQMCKSFENIEVEKIYFDCNNWGVILRKLF